MAAVAPGKRRDIFNLGIDFSNLVGHIMNIVQDFVDQFGAGTGRFINIVNGGDNMVGAGADMVDQGSDGMGGFLGIF